MIRGDVPALITEAADGERRRGGGRSAGVGHLHAGHLALQAAEDIGELLLVEHVGLHDTGRTGERRLLLLAEGYHKHLVELFLGGLHAHMQTVAGLHALGLHAHIGHFKHGTALHALGKRELAVGVGHGALTRAFHLYLAAYQRLAVLINNGRAEDSR